MTTITQGINDIQEKSLMFGSLQHLPPELNHRQGGKGLRRIKAVPPKREGPRQGLL